MQPGDAEANVDRYPWIYPERAITGVERVFLVRAINDYIGKSEPR